MSRRTFVVSYVDEDKIEKLAKSRGFDLDKGDGSYWDFCEPDEGERRITCKSASAALTLARKMLDRDIWRMTRVTEYDGAEPVQFWEVEDGTLELGKPDFVYRETCQ